MRGSDTRPTPHSTDARVRLAAVSTEPIAPDRLMTLVERPDAGAIALFVGRVRDHDDQASGPVVGLSYSSHPSANDVLGSVVAAALAEADPAGVCVAAAVHRIGDLRVGDAAFVVAVSAPHRRESFAACELIVERVKQLLPIWKQQFEADGSYRWSGL